MATIKIPKQPVKSNEIVYQGGKIGNTAAYVFTCVERQLLFFNCETFKAKREEDDRRYAVKGKTFCLGLNEKRRTVTGAFQSVSCRTLTAGPISDDTNQWY